jgi:pSer/pThr/pTyr-binding forkhead associated (FHA) protein
LDESISRFHAEIKYSDGKFLLRDSGSTTGTFIKIMEKTQIQPVINISNLGNDNLNGFKSISSTFY